VLLITPEVLPTQQKTIVENITSSKILETTEFEIKPQGWFGYIWTTVFFQPIYNVLIFIASVVPFNDLGLAIILLTILIRTILLLPSQKALKSQRKMNELQPKLAKIKEKYKDNQEMIAKETMALWKEYKVNPFGSCLPLLIQFPVLIALFYVIQDGLNPNNAFLLYEPLKHFSLQNIHVNFLNILDLTKINSIVLPLFVGGLQFLQMKLTMATKKDKKEDNNEKKAKGSEMEMAGKTMMYIMPVMIAIFTASVPAGVGLYWSVSTIYGIAQQIVVNKQVDDEKVKVKVLPDKK
jgi:YidC/Oxa1 family membrane protein insertase